VSSAGCTNCIIFFTQATYNSNLKIGGGAIGTIPGIPAASGTAGADALCNNQASGAPVTNGKTFKALIISSLRYPCNNNGVCGSAGWLDWPLKASTAYYTPVSTQSATSYSFFATSDVNGIFESSGGNLYSQGGGTRDGYFWSGINGFKVGATTGAAANAIVTGWSYANLSSVWPGNWSYYAAMNCSDWESTAGLYSTANCGMTGGLGSYVTGITTIGLIPESGYDIGVAKTYTSSYAPSTRWSIGSQMGTTVSSLICVEQ
jgi:hypothetical protein